MQQPGTSATCVLQSGNPVPKPQPAEGWAFVNLSEPRQSKDRSLRRLVRSNAMRDYCQKKKQSELKHRREPANTTAPHKVCDPSAVQNHEQSGCPISCGQAKCVHERRYFLSSIRSSPKQLLGDGGFDPFDASPIRGDSRYIGYALDHCEVPSHSILEHTCNPG